MPNLPTNFPQISNFLFPGGTSNSGHAKFATKIFLRFPTLHFQRGDQDIEFRSCQICHKNFHKISNFSFWSGGTSNFGHAKSAIKYFCQISNFSFPAGGGGEYIKFWSCQICKKKNKKISPNFQLFISWGSTLNFGHAKSAIKKFHKISNFLFPGGGTSPDSNLPSEKSDPGGGRGVYCLPISGTLD